MRRHACYLILPESITLMRDLSARWYVRWKRLPSEGGGGPLWSSQCNLRLIDGNCHHFVQGWATLDWGTCTSIGKVAMHNVCLGLPSLGNVYLVLFLDFESFRWPPIIKGTKETALCWYVKEIITWRQESMRPRTGYEVLKQCFPHNLCLEQCLQYLTQCFRCASINCSHPAFHWTISTIWWQQPSPQVQTVGPDVSINLYMEGNVHIWNIWKTPWEETAECQILNINPLWLPRYP